MTFSQWQCTVRQVNDLSTVPELEGYEELGPGLIYGEKAGCIGYIRKNPDDNSYWLDLPGEEICDNLYALERRLYKFIAGEQGWAKTNAAEISRKFGEAMRLLLEICEDEDAFNEALKKYELEQSFDEFLYSLSNKVVFK